MPIKPAADCKLEGRRAFDQSAEDEDILSSKQEPSCILFFCQYHVSGVLLQRNSLCAIVMTIMLCHSFAESHLIRERNSSAEAFLASQGRMSFFATASPSGKCVKGSHGGVLVAPRARCNMEQWLRMFMTIRSNKEAMIGLHAWSKP